MRIIPVFTLPLIAIMLFIPILSIEGITPWFIFVFFTYKIIKTSNIKDIENKLLIKKTITFFLLSILLGITYNILAIKITAFFINNIL